MSTSDTRRGPGWWMDLEGQWNPPESWPESSPPLPGWTRADDGSWRPPTEQIAEATSPLLAGTGSDLIEVPPLPLPKTPPIPESAGASAATSPSTVSPTPANPADTPTDESAPSDQPPKATSIALQYADTEAVVPQIMVHRRRIGPRTAALLAALLAMASAAIIVLVLAVL